MKNLDYDFVNLLNYNQCLNKNVLLIRVAKADFKKDNILREICESINKTHPDVDGKSIVIVFAVQDVNQPYTYKGNTECALWLSSRKYDSKKFQWKSEFPDIEKSPRKLKV